MNRHDFLRTGGAVGVGLAALGGSRLTAAGSTRSPRTPKSSGGARCRAWSFNGFTFFEAVDKTASLGLALHRSVPGASGSASGCWGAWILT